MPSSLPAQDYGLLDRWAAGDLPAGNALFERYFNEVYRFFEHKVGDDAGDLVQRTFLTCVERSAQFERRSSFRTFLYGVARHTLFGHFRRNHKRKGEVEASSLLDLAPSPSLLVEHRYEERVLLEALRSIALDFQIALELHYWEGLKGPELAEVLEIPEGTVRSRLRRAREALKERLDALESSERLGSTLTSLEGWAGALRRALDEP